MKKAEMVKVESVKNHLLKSLWIIQHELQDVPGIKAINTNHLMHMIKILEEVK